MLKIHTLRALKDNFVYVLAGPGHACAVIDPGEAAPVKAFLAESGLKLAQILLTHHHRDHIGGVAELATPGMTVSCSSYDHPRIPGSNLTLDEGSPFKVFGEKCEILALPGHTLGQIAYYFAGLNAIFTGDTLFTAGCGRLFEGTPGQMYASLQKIKALPPETEIYFGHEYSLRNLEFVLSRAPSPKIERYRDEMQARLENGGASTPTRLDVEVSVNPFLQAKSVAELAEWRTARDTW